MSKRDEYGLGGAKVKINTTCPSNCPGSNDPTGPFAVRTDKAAGLLAACLIGLLSLLTPTPSRAQGFTITTVAGCGNCGFQANGGDGGPATSATLGSPYAVTRDFAGNLFIADAGTNTVRRVSNTGVITTFAGTGFGFSGDKGQAILAEFAGPSSIARSEEHTSELQSLRH